MKIIRHIGIVVSDLEKSLYFYKDLLRLTVTNKRDESGGYIDEITGLTKTEVTTVKMSANGGTLIELLCFQSHSEKRANRRMIYDTGISHIAFTVKDIDSEYKRLSGSGVRFNSTPQVSPDGYAKVAFCVDPDGVFIELVEPLRK